MLILLNFIKEGHELKQLCILVLIGHFLKDFSLKIYFLGVYNDGLQLFMVHFSHIISILVLFPGLLDNYKCPVACLILF